jgi:4-amino-4-deoxy-L-arabinose transferase-like glycosyltransferase
VGEGHGGAGTEPPAVARRWTAVETFLLAAVLLVGIGLRIGYHGVEQYSRADETAYSNFSCEISRDGLGGFAKLSHGYLADERNWIYPSPARWGYILLGSVSADLFGCGPSGLAWLSTLAAIAALLFTAVIAYRLAGPRVAIIAAAMVATSPLQIDLGRRALNDEVFCAIALSALWAIIALTRAGAEDRWRPTRYVGAVAAMTLGLATKETFLLLYPMFLLPFFVGRTRPIRWLPDALVFVLPPILHYAGFSMLAGNGGDFWKIMNAVQSTAGADYPDQYQNGPWHRLLIDLFLMAPIACALAVATVGTLVESGAGEERKPGRFVALLLVGGTIAFCLVPSKCVRFVLVSDSLIRVLAAWGLVWWWQRARKPSWGLWIVVAILVASAAMEIHLFREVFITHGVYDPVSENLLRALKMIAWKGNGQ